MNVRIADLYGFSRIDQRRGAEILVRLNQSASGPAVGVYALRSGRLRYMAIEGRTHITGLFSHNQGGLAGDRADCWRPASGYVITMSYDATGPGQDVTRVLYRVAGDRFAVVWVRRYENTRKSFVEQHTRGPFGSCLTRR